MNRERLTKPRTGPGFGGHLDRASQARSGPGRRDDRVRRGRHALRPARGRLGPPGCGCSSSAAPSISSRSSWAVAARRRGCRRPLTYFALVLSVLIQSTALGAFVRLLRDQPRASHPRQA